MLRKFIGSPRLSPAPELPESDKKIHDDLVKYAKDVFRQARSDFQGSKDWIDIAATKVVDELFRLAQFVDEQNNKGKKKK